MKLNYPEIRDTYSRYVKQIFYFFKICKNLLRVTGWSTTGRNIDLDELFVYKLDVRDFVIKKFKLLDSKPELLDCLNLDDLSLISENCENETS